MSRPRCYSNFCKVKTPGTTRTFPVLVLFLCFAFLSPLHAVSESSDDINIPHVNKKARHNFKLYQQANGHKAFAIAPGGAWSWLAEMNSADEAENQALQSCRRNTSQKCVLYALDDQIVFNAEKWPTLWAPYAAAEDAIYASVGARVGQRLYNLSYKDGRGHTKSLSDSRGKLVMLHFWGSWCPSCAREFPQLQELHRQLEKKFTDKIDILFLQVREPFTQSQQWVRENGYASLPLYDSGSRGSDDVHLQLSQGDHILDRELAPVFPSTYILDQNGLVLFSHHGPVNNWQEYIPFIEHAVLLGISQSSQSLQSIH